MDRARCPWLWIGAASSSRKLPWYFWSSIDWSSELTLSDARWSAAAVGICCTIARNRQIATASRRMRRQITPRGGPALLKYGLERCVIVAQPGQVLAEDEARGERVLQRNFLVWVGEIGPEVRGHVHDFAYADQENVLAGHARGPGAHGRREEALANVGEDGIVRVDASLEPSDDQLPDSGARGTVVLHQGSRREQRGHKLDPILDKHGPYERVLEQFQIFGRQVPRPLHEHHFYGEENRIHNRNENARPARVPIYTRGPSGQETIQSDLCVLKPGHIRFSNEK